MAKKDKNDEVPAAESVSEPIASTPVTEPQPKPMPTAKPVRIINNSLQVQVVTLRMASGKQLEMTIPAKGVISWDTTENLGQDFESKRRKGLLSLSS